MRANGNLSGAVEGYRRALECNPNDVETHHSLAALYRTLGRPEEALTCYQAAVAIDPTNTDAQRFLQRPSSRRPS